MAEVKDLETEVTRVARSFDMLSRFVKAGRIGEEEARRRFAELTAEGDALRAEIRALKRIIATNGVRH